MMPMYEIAATFAVTLICIIVIPNIVVGYEHFCDWLDERRKRKKLIASLERDYQVWYIIAANEADPLEKGYAIARMLNAEHERGKIIK